MRGTPLTAENGDVSDGIIPAYAGNTMIVSVAHVHCRDHPRVCGEHFLRISHVVFREGSSPRMRGTQLCWFAHAPMAGIIPAYAGNTLSAPMAAAHTWDHPRVCGEHKPVSWKSIKPRGSSPRMRGTRCVRIVGRNAAGIIPAYAGNTGGSASPGFSQRDHPRVCGEHIRQTTAPPCAGGSSPRMRGTH